MFRLYNKNNFLASKLNILLKFPLEAKVFFIDINSENNIINQSLIGYIMKTNYVVGFAFNKEKTKLLLIKKTKPEWQAGLLQTADHPVSRPGRAKRNE